MELELHPAPDAAVLTAVSLAAEAAGVVPDGIPSSYASGWLHAARAEGVGGDPVKNAAQARSPRNTRGATRA
jgi:hypothetical protein